MSVPRRSNADGFSINVLNAILERPVETTTTTSMEEEEEENIDHREHPPIQRRKSFLDSTSISTSSKRSLHSSRQTLTDSKEFFRTTGCRWLRAVRRGEVATVKKMLEEKPELSQYAPNYGPLAIHMATVRGDRSIIMLLMAKGADVDARDATGYTSLHLAIRRGNQSLAHFLISQHRANIELIDPDGRHITDYDEWSEQDQLAAEKCVYGHPKLRPKSHTAVADSSPSSVSLKSSRIRPSSTPDTSMISESEREILKRDSKRSSWKSFFDMKPLVKKFGSGSSK